MNVTNTRATIWGATVETTPSGKEIVKGKISTSRKVGEEYKNSSWFVTFVGKCVPMAKQLNEKDRINILNAQITAEPYEKDGKKLYPTRVTIFDFEMLEQQQTETNSGFQPVEGEDDLPF